MENVITDPRIPWPMEGARIAVVGLGSPIMCDDAVGLRVSEEISRKGLEGVECFQEAIGGLDILPVIEGYDYAVIVDAIQTMEYEPGTILLYTEKDFEEEVAEAATHDVNLPTALKIGRRMEGHVMPKEVRFVAIEVADIKTMSETMTPPVEEAVPSAVEAVLHTIRVMTGQERMCQTSIFRHKL
jgi:hydrogenase maturation protease